jgi:tungstate transport system ATP-binding protein
MLALNNVSFQRDNKTLLHEITLSLDPNEITVLMGANGAGKSLLLQVLAGLLPLSSGQRFLQPQDCHLLWQQPIFLRRSAADNCRYAMQLRGPVDETLLADTLARLELSHLAKQAAQTLSGGEQQRLALARACLLKPKVVLLDEPTAALDPAATLQVEAAIRLLREQGSTVLMSTHQIGQAKRLADRVVFLSQGRCVANQLLADFFTDPPPAVQAYWQATLG